MKERLRILMLSVDIPSEIGTGSVVRSWYFLKELTNRADVDLMLPLNAPERGVLELSKLGCRVFVPQCEAGLNEVVAVRRPLLDRIRLIRDAAESIFLPFRDWMLPLRRCIYRFECALKSSGNRVWTRMFFFACLLVLKAELWLGEQLGLAAPIICSERYEGFLRSLRKLKDNVGAETDYDCIWFEHTVTYPLAQLLSRCFSRASLICNSHNIEFQLATRLSTSGISSGITRRQRQRIRGLRLVETASLNGCRITFVCSEEDRQDALKLCSTACVCIAPNGVDLLRFKPSNNEPATKNRTLIFTGGMNYRPNLDGVLFFLKYVFPQIRQSAAGTQLIIAGKSAGTELPESVLETDGIEVISDPEDMRPIFERATVAVVPLLSGGGTRLKILEAMAMQLPVVSTTIGAEGVPYENGRHLLIADEPTNFAQAVLHLLNNLSLRSEIANAGREFVEDGYDWAAITSVAVNHAFTDVHASRVGIETYE